MVRLNQLSHCCISFVLSDFTLIANERLSPENFKVLCSSVHEGVLFCF